MADKPLDGRFESALKANAPAEALARLALALKDEAMPLLEIHALFDEHRAKHENDADATLYDAILETMDLIDEWGRHRPDTFADDTQ